MRESVWTNGQYPTHMTVHTTRTVLPEGDRSVGVSLEKSGPPAVRESARDDAGSRRCAAAAASSITRKQAWPPGQARVNTLSCQLGPACSLVEGTSVAAGRSLPGMSLAFALMAAINGSTGSCATLSLGR